MKKQNFKHRAFRFLTIIIGIALFVTMISLIESLLKFSSDTISLVVSTLEAGGLIVSLFIAIQQLSDSKEIARADFLVELNNSFINNEGNLQLYTALQDCVDNKCCHKNSCGTEGKCVVDLPKVVVSNYLTFFETVYLLICNGVITLEMIDDLFAYRFFLAIHSEFVQQQKLATQPENFKNIFCLEYKWLKYRRETAHKIDSADSVYHRLPLSDLMKTAAQKKLYRQWIQEANKQ